MPATANLAAYADVRAVFDQGLALGFPLHYTLPTPQAAARWRFRAYSFRKRTAVREYQCIVMKIEAAEPCTIVLEEELLGVLTDAEGVPVPLDVDKIPSEDEMMKQLRKELLIDKE